MSEKKWLAATDPTAMLQLVRRKAGDRKLRLVACACCRHVLYLCVEEARLAVDVAERFADRKAGDAELAAARASLQPYIKCGPEYVPWLVTVETADQAASEVAEAVPGCAAEAVAVTIEESGSDPEFGTPEVARAKAQAHCAAALRCVFGNPFRKRTIRPDWRTSDSVALAVGIDAERAFDRMPILADALEEAGCDDTDVLAHLRGGGPHFHGCWVLDLVLGKN